ncbi:MAG TPA: 50S ribosomal protein L18 [Geothrix sp.]|nr:50S ribosomal protein L18 [Geothrix sp.]
MANDIQIRRDKTKARIRGRVSGTAERPRLTIYKSLKRIYVQAVDDAKGVTLAAASSLEKDLRGTLKNGANIEAAKAVGASIAARLKEKGITAVVFDRNGYVYHGRVKALADSAREAGLQF